MNLLRKLIEVTSIRMPLLFAKQTSSNVRTRKEELIDLGLTILIVAAIVIFKVNKAQSL